MLTLVDDWEAYLCDPCDEEIAAHIKKHSRTGRPLGDERFVRSLEHITGRVLRRRRLMGLPRAALPANPTFLFASRVPAATNHQSPITSFSPIHDSLRQVRSTIKHLGFEWCPRRLREYM
jgi:hypothetical protein